MSETLETPEKPAISVAISVFSFGLLLMGAAITSVIWGS